MLSLDIEWLLGVCFAARSPADDAPDWPPQPDRVFSALAASWGARGARPGERAALEWLEGLDPPEIRKASSGVRTTVTAYVPPNDAAPTDIRVLPALRRRQPRRFPATTLPLGSGKPHLRLTWNADPPPDHFAALATLARHTSYVGHSSSLVRCLFHGEADEAPELEESAVTAAPYPGRLEELESLYARHVGRADASARPRPARLAHPAEPARVAVPRSLFGERWTVLEYASGARPDLRAAAVIGRTMRDALMSAWPDPIPGWLSGHAPDGAPSREPHLAVAPLANVGFGWSDGSWHGLALILPRALEESWLRAETPAAFAERRRLDLALAGLAENGSEPGLIPLHLGKLGTTLLRVVSVPEKESLRPRRYIGPSRLWSTATPIALDRHPKTADPRAEAVDAIAASCARIGLPAPIAVQVHKHAAVARAPSAWPAGGSPRWEGWARPRSLGARPLTHATLLFASPVVGPLVLGAGRFFGLGLCLPLDKGPEA